MKNFRKLTLGLVCFLFLCGSCAGNTGKRGLPESKTLSLAQLQDKIKGGWAGQTIGVSFGAPTEFNYNGVMIPDSVSLGMTDDQIERYFNNDDIYLDLSFVEVLERVGLDAPADSFAVAFARAGYELWHANQAARYNILNGIMPPESGHWLNNPHADDIDYQIESDFAGLMNPGMPNSASEISDKVGHIMNYGDGWYGGVYVGAMYALAFVSDDIHFVVNEALKTIPEQSDFYQCIADVIKWHKQYPDDWKQNWHEIQKKWAEEVGCPDGVFAPFNIDAKINAAYIVLGLLYGAGDYTKTLEISTRAGQDSDCNPSSAGGILGTMLGYSNIPEYWKRGLADVEDINLDYTVMSLNKAYEISYKHALEMIKRNEGKVGDSEVTIAVQAPEPVRYEKSFEGLYPVERVDVRQHITSTYTFEFEGTGVVLRGEAQNGTLPDYTFDVEILIDGRKIEAFSMPTDYRTRKLEICWKYQLPKGKHVVEVVVTNPKNGYSLWANDYLVYSDEPQDGINMHTHTHAH
jgi:ADP-ribosylglycohydrolase.